MPPRQGDGWNIWHIPGMKTNDGDGAAVRFPPPLVYLAALIAGVLLHAFVFPLSFELTLGVRIGAASAAVLVGLAVIGSAIGMFKKTGQDPKPWKTTPEIISTGIYRTTRNPMYVSLALLQAGIGIGLANGWVVVLILPVLVIIYAIAIRPEEAYLERKFGDAYTEYKKSVRRWI